MKIKGGNRMFYRHLGSTDLKISVLGLGLVKIGRNTGVKYPKPFDLPSDPEVLNLLKTAQNLGINFLDTAPAYGNSEERLGKIFNKNFTRSDWIIETKVGEEFENNSSSFDFSPAHINKSVERSLKRLGTDYLDIVLVHSDGNDVKIIEQDEVFLSLEKLKQLGKIRAFGMSTKTLEGAKLAIDHSDLVMLTYNLKETGDGVMIDYAHQNKKGVLIKKGLQSGHATSPKESIDFIFEKLGVTSFISGTIDLNHLRENAQLVEEVCAE
jgi:aryl-alcohol dehydrogenase-like predicted oxidoreductase